MTTAPRVFLWAIALLSLQAAASGFSSERMVSDNRDSASQSASPEFTRAYPLTKCTFGTTGRTPYFVLQPGHTLVLENKTGTQLTITVLDRTEVVGGVTTRVVEERETERGALVEVSRNYFAICQENQGVFYFGEDVDMYKSGKIINHEGAWRHGNNGATAGLMMPALPLLGSRYHQEVAPGVAMDRAEVTAMGAKLATPYGTLTDVVLTRESSPLEPATHEVKGYAPGIGIVQDSDLLLVSVNGKRAIARTDRLQPGPIPGS